VKIIKTKKDLATEISKIRSMSINSKVGFIPTMGALHQGHMSLVHEAKLQTDIVVVSIFVNPTQFNDAKDLDKYPRTEVVDSAMLIENGCDILFLPTVETMYPDDENQNYHINLNSLGTVMEGKFRDNHFDGVCNIVEKLFRLITPDIAFFGLKDFQQVAVVKRMVQIRDLDLKIHACPIIRTESGLAMSSRNMLLSETQKEDAKIINETLNFGKALALKEKNAALVSAQMQNFFNQGKLDLEYLEIVDNISLKPVNSISESSSCCIAAFCGKVRLIDNIQFT